jgi:3-carboxy-cis,cis-muconate cycloisomerase
MALHDNLIYSEHINHLFSDEAMIGAMLRFEAALAVAQGQCGLVPTPSVKVIENCCKTDFINISQLKTDTALAGNPAIPLVKQLIQIVKKQDLEAAKYVHNGATSQDVIDTAMVLQLQHAFDFFEKQLAILQKKLVALTQTHRQTLMIGRTLLQQARPITFGLKTAMWLDGISRSMERLKECKNRVLALQLGGAVGSLAGMEGKGLEVAEEMAKIFNQIPPDSETQNPKSEIATPSVSWHTQRDRLVEMATTLGILSGSLGKIAKDVVLMMQTEVAEVFEGAAEGKGGSSTMPHKRNPVTSTAIVANAQRVPNLVAAMLGSMGQEHERSAGIWHSEWAVLPEIVQLTAGSLERCIDLIAHLEVDTTRMLQNIEATNGLIFAENVSLALAVKIGKADAHHLVEKACKTAVVEKKHLKDILEKDDVAAQYLPPSVLADLFNPQNSIGLNDALIDRVLNSI